MARVPLSQILLLLVALPAACTSYEPIPVSADAHLAAIEKRDDVADGEELPPTPPLLLDPEHVRVAEHVDPADGFDLSELNAIALRYAPELLEARCNARIAAAQLSVAGLPANPALFVGPRLGDGWSGLILPVSLAFELVLNDRLEAERERSTHEHAAARHRIAAAELDTLADVYRRVVRLRALRARVKAIEPLSEMLAGVPARVRARQDAGEEEFLGDAFLIVGLERVLLDDERWRDELAQAEAELAAVVGLAPVGVDVLTDEIPLNPIEESGDGWRRLPSVLAAVEDLRAAEQEVRRAVEARVPSLRVGPEFESDDGDKTTGIGVGGEIPVIDDGSPAVREAEARRDAARAQLDAALLLAASRREAARMRLVNAERAWDRRAGLPLLDPAPLLRALEQRVAAGEVSPTEAAVLLPTLIDALVVGIEIDERRSLARIDAAVTEGAWLLPPEASPEDPNADLTDEGEIR